MAVIITIIYLVFVFKSESKLVHKTQWHNIAIFKPYLQQKAEEMVTKG